MRLLLVAVLLVSADATTVQEFCDSISGNYSTETGSCFKLYNTEIKKWVGAHSSCAAVANLHSSVVRARLAHIYTTYTFDTVRKLPNFGTSAFVGVRSIVPESSKSQDIRWLEDYDTFSECGDKTGTGEVSFQAGGSNQDCFVMFPTGSHKLEDWGCTGWKNWICEFLPATQVIQSPPDKCPMDEKQKAARDDCTKLNGVYTGPECYIFGSLDIVGLGQDEAFNHCPAGTFLAHLYDYKNVIRALDTLKFNLNGKTLWTAGKAYQTTGPVKGDWKRIQGSQISLIPISLPEAYEAEGFRAEYPAIKTGNMCMVVEGSATEMTTTFTRCQAGPSQLFGALCMKYTYLADYTTIPRKRVMATTETLTMKAGVEDSWFCGLACRREPGCLQFNFNDATLECALIRHKVEKGGEWPAGYNLTDDNTGWNTFVRDL